MTVGCSSQVDAVEITYVDPTSGNICRKDVFCDPQQWQWRWQARFLISSELVNLLSEAHHTRRERAGQLRAGLTSCRLGYLCDLQRLRRVAQSCAAALVQAEDATHLPPGEGELCPVHFFTPDRYIDSWTLEGLAAATRSCKDALQEEIRELVTQVDDLGGGTWEQLLEMILSKGVPLTAVAGDVMGTCQDAEERRGIENHITGGLLDGVEELRPAVEELEAEMDDYELRRFEVHQTIGRHQQEGQRLEELLRGLRARLSVPAPKREVKKLSPEEEAQRLEDAFRAALEEWAGRLASVGEELAGLRELLEAWQARLAGCDEEGLRGMEQRIGELGRQLRVLEARVEAVREREQQLREQAQGLQERAEGEREAMHGLRERLSLLPPPNPGTFAHVRLKRELKALQREEALSRKKMLGPYTRIKAIRHELRLLYRNLGWEWDLSDSDDDGNDKPYWERRKLAVNGLTPFDERLFLYAEQPFQKRRLKRNERKQKTSQAATLLSQMTARRYRTGSAATGRGPVGDGEEPEDVLPFKRDSDHAKPPQTGRRLLSSRDGLALSQWSHGAAELEWSAAHAVRMQELHISFEDRLRQCTTCFINLLPSDGVLGGLRARLIGILDELNSMPSSTSEWEEEAVQDRLDCISDSLHKAIDEVASLGDHVHPISGALQHSVEFGELRRRLTDVQYDQHRLQHEMRATLSSSPMQRSRGVARELVSETWPGASGASPSASPHWRATSAPSEPPRLLKPPPRLGALTETVVGTAGRGKRRRDLVKPEVVDFGFRPDGAGEESVENWSLFKVSRGSFGSVGTTAPSSTLRGSSSTGFRDIASSKLMDLKAARFQKLAPDCDFREYICQTQQSSEEMWRSSSAPELLAEKKRGPSLPQLVKEPRKGRGSPAGGRRSALSRTLRSPARQVSPGTIATKW